MKDMLSRALTKTYLKEVRPLGVEDSLCEALCENSQLMNSYVQGLF